MANVSIDQLASLIAKSLEGYAEDVEEKIEYVITETAEETKKSLEQNPNIPEQTGDYKKGFYTKVMYKSKGKKGYKMVVANKKYRLTHLLENGHVKKGGGRTRAYKHWEEAQAVAETLPERIRGAIEG
ncbi:MAG: HK97 gp10 family phage protein [Anaerotignaceae bacterium]